MEVTVRQLLYKSEIMEDRVPIYVFTFNGYITVAKS